MLTKIFENTSCFISYSLVSFFEQDPIKTKVRNLDHFMSILGHY